MQPSRQGVPKSNLHILVITRRALETKNSGSAACHKENLVLVQKKRGNSHSPIWENGGVSSQRPSPLPVQACSSYRVREGRAIFFLSNYLASCQHAGALSIPLSSLWCIQCKNLPCAILANGGDSLMLPVYGIWSVGKEDCKAHCQEAWSCPHPQPTSQHWTPCCTSRGASWKEAPQYPTPLGPSVQPQGPPLRSGQLPHAHPAGDCPDFN